MTLTAVFTMGFYALVFIATQNASRVAAMRNSGGPESAENQKGACRMAIDELRGLPGIGESFSSDCTSGILIVSSVLCDSSNPCALPASAGVAEPAVAVTVRYALPDVLRLPALDLSAISRVTHARIRYLP